tara:strand:- start:83 stop:469 length:387 start_codon:yes stop_codon:yes gene_type:complete
MASYCEACGKIFDGKWDNCPECGNVANKLSSANVKIDKPNKRKQSKPKETVPSSKTNNRDNKGNDFAFIGGILRDMAFTLERLDHNISGRLDDKLSEMNDHLWWLTISIKVGFFMATISFIILLVSLL